LPALDNIFQPSCTQHLINHGQLVKQYFDQVQLKADVIGSIRSVIDLHYSISLAYTSKPWLPWKFLVQRSELGGPLPQFPPSYTPVPNPPAMPRDLSFAANGFVFRCINREHLYRTFSVNFGGGRLPKCIWISRQTASFMDIKNVKMRPWMFYKACTEKTSKMRLNFTANSFVFRRINREISPITLFYKPCKRKSCKMRLNITAKSYVFGRINREKAPRAFSAKLAKNFKNVSELHSKQLGFWTHKSW